MSIEQDVQDYVVGQLALQEIKLRDLLEAKCLPRCHQLRTDLQVIKSGMDLHMGEDKVLTEKIDQMQASVTRIAKMLEGNGHGSIDTQLQLMRQEQQHLRELFDTSMADKKAEVIDRKETLRRALLAALPEFLRWLAVGIAILVGLTMNRGGQSTTTNNNNPSPPAVATPKTP